MKTPAGRRAPQVRPVRRPATGRFPLRSSPARISLRPWNAWFRSAHAPARSRGGLRQRREHRGDSGPTPRPVSLTLAQTLTLGNEASAVAFSPDGRLLAAGGGDIGMPSVVHLYSVPAFTEVATIPGFFRTAYSLAFTPGGAQLAGGGDEVADDAARLWEVPGGRRLWSRDRYLPAPSRSAPTASGWPWPARTTG